jgi:ABC-type multidrug transport system ATPase subunit
MTEAPTSAVEMSGLRVRHGEVEVVSCIDLTVERAAVVALLGPNGAGKSTTINSLIGLKRPHQGQVTVEPCTIDAGRQELLSDQPGTAGLIDHILVSELLMRRVDINSVGAAIAEPLPSITPVPTAV